MTRGTVPDRIVSTADPDARHVHKTRSHYQDGYKAHLAVAPETGLFTAVALTPRQRERVPRGEHCARPARRRGRARGRLR
ncbi:transposase [Kitasatospora terrestris]|uniref:transposase n=1 Tax=Kitasatospora terrestris TaxID=258051 RepID=UPI0031EB5834